MKQLMIILTGAVLLITSSGAAAPKPFAWVAIQEAAGKGEPRRALVRSGQQIGTGRTSTAEIHFGLFGLMRLKEDSQVELRMLDLGARHSRVQVKLLKGSALMWMGAKKSGGSQFLLSTPAAVISGMSAAVVVEVESAGSTVVKVIDGSVQASDLVEENDRGEAVEGPHIEVLARHQLVWEDGIPAETAGPIPSKELEGDIAWINEPEVPDLKRGKKIIPPPLSVQPEITDLKKTNPR